MEKITIAFLISLVCVLILHLGLSTMEEEEPNHEPIAVDTFSEEDRLSYTYTISEEDRLNYTYTISAIYEYQVYSGKGNEKENRYKVVFEDHCLTKVRATGLTFTANEEFGSKLLVGHKLTVKEIEENLIY